jgi:hypothetical protein
MYVGLLYLCAITGLIVVVGSLLLIWTGRIVIDKDGGSVSEVQLPFGFKLHTQLPVVIMFFFGAFLLALPVILVRKSLEDVPILTLTGTLKAHPGSSYTVYVSADDSHPTTDVLLRVPFVKTTVYKVMYYDRDRFVTDEPVDWSKVVNDRYQLKGFKLEANVPNDSPRVPDSVVTKEAPGVVNQYKDEK